MTVAVAANLVLPVLGAGRIGAVIGLGLIGFGMGLVVVTNFAIMSEILPEARGTLLSNTAIMLELGMGAGTALAPFLFRYGIAGNGLAAAVLYVLALIIFRVFVVRRLPERVLQ